MSKGGKLAFYIYLVITIIFFTVGLYTESYISNNPKASDIAMYQLIYSFALNFLIYYIIPLIFKILQAIFKWKFFAFLCIFANVNIIIIYVERIIDSHEAILSTIVFSILFIVAIISEIKGIREG